MLSVILKSSVRGLGKAGEIAKVRPGYARYLLADGKAVRATKDNVALLEQKLALIEEENSKKLAEAEGVAKSLGAERLIIVRQSSDDGKLFGSVTVRDVSKLLCDLGYDIQPRCVSFSEVIKRTGEYEINVELHADLVAALQLHVVRNESEAERVRLGIAKSEDQAAAAAEVEQAEDVAAAEQQDSSPVDDHADDADGATGGEGRDEGAGDASDGEEMPST
ncbi:50S ribosomal protein L9 [Anaplasma marginale]|uniref:Large ribosomal subunit protein bL9 n=2 Tax=Anaplasma marginale TaxID=770 RepID=RL9_ANAMM|nr:50S ribosomal protein L9 [Anaplasma marginale]Q5PBM9.1 RecName: Full=Large ribosomal subunit protein bL9; AltName: Full=50S ribosomal protein L9 [Anaplasma marginale str. St. Maries]AAV86300.1 ribosomal protein L9 [Anaplasma marginale str. St. Maries]KAA8474283.1 50S ribosomal protein L9 [Anaplasma marginale]KAB0452013.1 50S ribosomal protein L9 [Anaplasma marginale]RCL19534.1 50S ribosomal protein L9 [Anaplasma marginale]